MGYPVDKYVKRIEAQLDSFHYETAVALSSEMHEAQNNGYFVTMLEDRLWQELMDKISDERSKSKQ